MPDSDVGQAAGHPEAGGRTAGAPGAPRREEFGFDGPAPVPISLAVRAGDFIFVSGLSDHFFKPEEVTFDDAGEVIDDGGGAGDEPIEEQTRKTLLQVDKALRRAGCTLDDVVDVLVWLKHRRDFLGFNAVYKQFFTRTRPARAVVRNDFMFKTRIEIKVVAYKPRMPDAGGGA